MRRKVMKSKDRRIFQNTAYRTKSINLRGSNMRGGIRL